MVASGPVRQIVFHARGFSFSIDLDVSTIFCRGRWVIDTPRTWPRCTALAYLVIPELLLVYLRYYVPRPTKTSLCGVSRLFTIGHDLAVHAHFWIVDVRGEGEA